MRRVSDQPPMALCSRSFLYNSHLPVHCLSCSRCCASCMSSTKAAEVGLAPLICACRFATPRRFALPCWQCRCKSATVCLVIPIRVHRIRLLRILGIGAHATETYGDDKSKKVALLHLHPYGASCCLVKCLLRLNLSSGRAVNPYYVEQDLPLSVVCDV